MVNIRAARITLALNPTTAAYDQIRSKATTCAQAPPESEYVFRICDRAAAICPYSGTADTVILRLLLYRRSSLILPGKPSTKTKLP